VDKTREGQGSVAKKLPKITLSAAEKKAAIDAAKNIDSGPSPAKYTPAHKRRIEFSDQMADQIIELMVDGHDLVKACHLLDISRMVVYRWMDEVPSFKTRCARAREALADYDAFRIAEIAEKATADSAQADRVKLAALQWLASKRAPKVYGDKIEIDATVEVNRGPSEQLLTFLDMAERLSKPSSSN